MPKYNEKEYKKNLRLERKAKGICYECNLPAEENRTRCTFHARRNVEYSSSPQTRLRKEQLRGKRRAAGLCTKCGQPSLGEVSLYCSACKDKLYKNTKKYTWSHHAYAILKPARIRAKRKGVEFNLTVDDISPLPTHCPVLGIELIYIGTEGHTGVSSENSPSLDRINPSLGYVRGNVAIISKRANSIKNNASVLELEAVADWLARNNY